MKYIVYENLHRKIPKKIEKGYFYPCKIQQLCYIVPMNCNEFKRWLRKQGCVFEKNRGKGSHITVRYQSNISVLPMHGKKELPKGTVEAIKKQLGLKRTKK